MIIVYTCIATMIKTKAVQDYIRSITSKGGKARAAKLSKERRSEIARMGGLARKKALAKQVA